MAVGLGLSVAGGLALTFPYQSLESRIARQSQVADALQMEYIRLWLRARPEAHALRFLLAQQLALIGDYAGARAELQRLIRHAEPQLAEQAVLFEIDVGLREAYTLDTGDPLREQLLTQLRNRMNELKETDWSPDLQLKLAKRAVQLQARDAAFFWYSQLLTKRIELPPETWEEAARHINWLGDPELSAQMYFRAQLSTTQLSEKRRLFIAALRTLESSGRYERALKLADTHLGELSNDNTTLEFLTRFALAANRLDLAQHYARRLLRMHYRNSKTAETP